MKFKIKLVVIIFVMLGFFGNLSGQNAFYDAKYLSDINKEDLKKYIALLQKRKDLSPEISQKIANPEEVKKELWEGLLFLEVPFQHSINIKKFKNAYQIADTVLKDHKNKFEDKVKSYLEYIKKTLEFKSAKEDGPKKIFKDLSTSIKLLLSTFQEEGDKIKELGEIFDIFNRSIIYLEKPWEKEEATEKIEEFIQSFKKQKEKYDQYKKKFREKIIKEIVSKNSQFKKKLDEEKKELLILEAIEKKAIGIEEEKSFESIESNHPSPQAEAVSPTSGKFFNSTFQTNLIDALGTLIAERFKEDVTIMYIEKFKKALKTGKYKEIYKVIEQLLPEIYNLVDKKDPFTYLSLGKEWKAAFEKDIENLPKHIVHYLKTSDFFNKESKLYPYLELAFEISDKLINGYHPVEILNYLDILYKEKKEENSKKVKKEENSKKDFYETFYKTIHFFNLVQLNLHKHKSGNSSNEDEFSGWVNFSDLKKLMVQKIGEKNTRVTYFLALLYHQDKPFFDNVKIGKNWSIDWLKETEKLFVKRILPFYQIMVKINEFDKKRQGTSEDYAKYMQLSLDVLTGVYDILEDTTPVDDIIKKPPSDKVPGFKIAQKLLDMYKSIYKKDYKNLISQVLSLIKEFKGEIFKDYNNTENLKKLNTEISVALEDALDPEKKYTEKYKEEYKKLENSWENIKGKIIEKIGKLDKEVESEKIISAIPLYVNFQEELDKSIKQLKENKLEVKELENLKTKIENYKLYQFIDKFIAVLAKYGAFIEGIANAKDATEMKNVIAAVILPRGSFLQKRTSKFSITIAAHPGVFLGRERLSNVDDITNSNGVQTAALGITANDEIDKFNTRKWAWVTGFTAPLGIEFCWGSKNPCWFISSCGIFLSVIDLGAVVSYRLTKSSDDYNGMPDKITFKQIFSPGASLNFGIKSSPITIRLGVQYTPELRKIKEEGIIVDEKKSWRFFGGFSWDIPLISITPKIRK